MENAAYIAANTWFWNAVGALCKDNECAEWKAVVWIIHNLAETVGSVVKQVVLPQWAAEWVCRLRGVTVTHHL